MYPKVSSFFNIRCFKKALGVQKTEHSYSQLGKMHILRGKYILLADYQTNSIGVWYRKLLPECRRHEYLIILDITRLMILIIVLSIDFEQ